MPARQLSAAQVIRLRGASRSLALSDESWRGTIGAGSSPAAAVGRCRKIPPRSPTTARTMASSMSVLEHCAAFAVNSATDRRFGYRPEPAWNVKRSTLACVAQEVQAGTIWINDWAVTTMSSRKDDSSRAGGGTFPIGRIHRSLPGGL